MRIRSFAEPYLVNLDLVEKELPRATADEFLFLYLKALGTHDITTVD